MRAVYHAVSRHHVATFHPPALRETSTGYMPDGAHDEQYLVPCAVYRRPQHNIMSYQRRLSECSEPAPFLRTPEESGLSRQFLA